MLIWLILKLQGAVLQKLTFAKEGFALFCSVGTEAIDAIATFSAQ
jgi:hypothetical protein